MQLIDNEFITKSIAEQLAKDLWTIERLATAQRNQLVKYKGIGATTAVKIIGESQRMINEWKLNEAARHVIPERATIDEQSTIDEQPAMSARVKRIREQDA